MTAILDYQFHTWRSRTEFVAAKEEMNDFGTNFVTPAHDSLIILVLNSTRDDTMGVQSLDPTVAEQLRSVAILWEDFIKHTVSIRKGDSAVFARYCTTQPFCKNKNCVFYHPPEERLNFEEKHATDKRYCPYQCFGGSACRVRQAHVHCEGAACPRIHK
jgi:hypothetical protein